MLRRVGPGRAAAPLSENLSGGEQQRVALARAFVMQPQAAARRRADRQPRRGDRRRRHRSDVRAQRRARHHAGAGHPRRRARAPLHARDPARRRAHRGGLNVRLALTLICWRDWRAGELRVLALALVIAVASVTSVGFFADRVRQALTREAHQLLGARRGAGGRPSVAQPTARRNRPRAACGSPRA